MPTVLTVDDELNVRLLISVNFMARGIEVIEAETAEVALEKLNRFIPDLILLDIGLPSMDGWEFLNCLALEPQFQNIRVLLLTSSTTDPAQKTPYAWIVGHLVKPVSMSHLIQVVSTLLQKN